MQDLQNPCNPTSLIRQFFLFSCSNFCFFYSLFLLFFLSFRSFFAVCHLIPCGGPSISVYFYQKPIFDYLINTSVIGTRLALNADSEDFPNACAFSAFRPLKVKLDGRFDVDVGTPIRIYSIKTNPDGSYVYEDGEIVREEIETYLFTRTLTGIKALTDEIETKGMM